MNEVSTATLYDADIAVMVEQLQDWHAKRIEQLQTLVEAQEDVTLVLKGADGNELELTGDVRIGFKAGIRVALERFAVFPLRIEATVSDDDEEE